MEQIDIYREYCKIRGGEGFPTAEYVSWLELQILKLRRKDGPLPSANSANGGSEASVQISQGLTA